MPHKEGRAMKYMNTIGRDFSEGGPVGPQAIPDSTPWYEVAGGGLVLLLLLAVALSPLFFQG